MEERNQELPLVRGTRLCNLLRITLGPLHIKEELSIGTCLGVTVCTIFGTPNPLTRCCLQLWYLGAICRVRLDRIIRLSISWLALAATIIQEALTEGGSESKEYDIEIGYPSRRHFMSWLTAVSSFATHILSANHPAVNGSPNPLTKCSALYLHKPK